MSRKKNKSRTRTWFPKAKAKSYVDPRVGDMALWIDTPFGILMPSKRPEKLLAEGDDRTLQVRARRREYLDAFREFFCPELGESEHHPNQDYPWKAAVNPDKLATAVARMVLAIDSEKFKPLAYSSKYALKDAKLRADLGGAYHSMWSTQLSRLSDGTSSYDWKPGSYVRKSIDECARLGHWWPTGKRLCSDCGKPRPEGSDINKPGPTGIKPGKDEVAAWKEAEKKRDAETAKLPPTWQKTVAPWSGTDTAGTGGFIESLGVEADIADCTKWGHFWPASRLTCKYCDEPRPDGTDDDQDVTLAISGTLYIDGDPIGQYDPDLGFIPGPPAEEDRGQDRDLEDDFESMVSSCRKYGHLWEEHFEECQYCGAERPSDYPFDVELTSDRDGYYYVNGMLTEPVQRGEQDASGEQPPGEMAPTGAETEEKASA